MPATPSCARAFRALLLLSTLVATSALTSARGIRDVRQSQAALKLRVQALSRGRRVCSDCVALFDGLFGKDSSEAGRADAAAKKPELQGRATGFMAALDDDIDFFGGSGGGGVLTREGIRNAQRVSSPIIDAEERLQEAMEMVGSMRPTEAAEMMQRLLAEARAVGADEQSPPMRAAASLLVAIELAAKHEAAEQSGEPDDVQAKLDVLFADPYEMDD